MLHSTRQLCRHLARALNDLRQINVEAGYRQAKVTGMADEMSHFGGSQQRLGRDTAPIETDATQMLALNQRRLQPQLCRANGSHIATRPTTHDDQIKSILAHLLLL